MVSHFSDETFFALLNLNKALLLDKAQNLYQRILLNFLSLSWAFELDFYASTVCSSGTELGRDISNVFQNMIKYSSLYFIKKALYLISSKSSKETSKLINIT